MDLSANIVLECPFCKTTGIPYGALVCKDCDADIEYSSNALQTRSTNCWRAGIAAFFLSLVLVVAYGALAGTVSDSSGFVFMAIFTLGVVFVVYSWHDVPELGTDPHNEIVKFRRGRRGSSVIVGVFTDV